MTTRSRRSFLATAVFGGAALAIAAPGCAPSYKDQRSPVDELDKRRRALELEKERADAEERERAREEALRPRVVPDATQAVEPVARAAEGVEKTEPASVGIETKPRTAEKGKAVEIAVDPKTLLRILHSESGVNTLIGPPPAPSWGAR